MLLKCCTQYASKCGKLSSAHRTGMFVFLAIPKKVISKNVQLPHSCTHLTCYQSNFSKQFFNSTWTVKFHMFKLDLEKTEEPEIKLPSSIGFSKKQENSRKIPTSALLTMQKPLTVWITTNCGKFTEIGIPDHFICLLRNLCRSRSNSKNWTLNKLVPSWERSTSMLYIVTPS